ncbi:hypothetical protein F4780DRAFT_720235 [Xylariomycetidae sp. FL0641]|nr:hypothetical protein F4780DRAFT_720235 [Xylariomycetidae sp. FL0641]
MEEAAKTIENLSKHILPPQAHYLSLSAVRKYRPHPDPNILDEREIRPLQYTTFLSDADRGLLMTRAAFDVLEDPVLANNAPAPVSLRADPNKPKKKVSLKDYKNRKTEGESPPKSDMASNNLPTIKEKEREAPKKPSAPTSRDMDSRRDAKKSTTGARPESHRHRSPSPERKKRQAETEEKPVKRLKVGDATPSAPASRPSKDISPQKSRIVPQAKNGFRDPKAVPSTNGRAVSSNTSNHVRSPKPGAQVNGTHKTTATKEAAQKKTTTTGTPNAKSLPPLLSPTLAANVSDLVKDDNKSSRPSPKKKLPENNSANASAKKARDDREPSPGPKKKKQPLQLPPLLSPTLPPVVLEELARVEKKPSKEPGQKGSPSEELPPIVKKTTKPATRHEPTHDSKKEERTSFMVTMKYRKSSAKTIKRLLALPPSGGKKKSEVLKKDERNGGERSGSVEPGTARKRPRTGTDASEASKRPRVSETLRPSTPPRQSSSMTRVASSSSHAGTPSVANDLTPAAQRPQEQKRPPLDPEKLQQVKGLNEGHRYFMQIGTTLKHQRDGIVMKAKESEKERIRQVAMAAGVQSLVAYLHAVQLESNAKDIKGERREYRAWASLLPLFRAVRNDCRENDALSALLLRIQGICLTRLEKTLWYSEYAEKLLANSRERDETWRLADLAREKLRVLDGHSDSPEVGPIGKLLDHLGPWSMPDKTIWVSLEVLKKVFRSDSPCKLDPELAKVGRSAAPKGTAS